jgi:hypothetical protein
MGVCVCVCLTHTHMFCRLDGWSSSLQIRMLRNFCMTAASSYIATFIYIIVCSFSSTVTSGSSGLNLYRLLKTFNKTVAVK